MIVYGHRGAKGEAPENTMASFLYARQLSLDGVEFDVRLSSDNKLVVIHDDTVERTTDGHGKVASLSASKLAKLDARADFPDWPTVPGVPELDDALGACSGIPRLAINIQPDDSRRLKRAAGVLVETLERRCLPDRVIVVSRSVEALEHVGALAPAWPRCLLAPFEEPRDLEEALRLDCRRIAVPLATGSALLVHYARNRGIGIMGWIANTAEDVAAFAAWNVESVVSDFPSLARRAAAAYSLKPRPGSRISRRWSGAEVH